jgi:hypothetical protein
MREFLSEQLHRVHLRSKQRVQAFNYAVRRIVPWTIEHALYVGGHAAIAFGAWMIYHPLGPIIGGFCAIKIALLISAERR